MPQSFGSLPDGALFKVEGRVGTSMKLWQPIEVDDSTDEEINDGHYWAVRQDGKPDTLFPDERNTDKILVTLVEGSWPA